jgi:two-component system sensor histidine kinase KdpD
LLFLAVAVAIGRLAGLEAARTEEAADRAREAQALFRISRSLATSRDLAGAANSVLAELRASGTMDRIWLGLGPTTSDERIVADTAGEAPLPVPMFQVVLQRSPGDEPTRWVRTHVGAAPRRGPGRGGQAGATVHRVRVEVGGETLGSLWALRSEGERAPERSETRLLSAAADQLGQAVRRDGLVAEALEAEVARRSDALKTALLDSVSHDLRTPLATIRAAAGSLLDAGVAWSPTERADALRSIDAEAARMSHLVRDLLDLSRIEGGALRPELEPHDLDEMIARVVRRTPTSKPIELGLPGDLPPLLVDDTYLDEILTNVVENAVRYGGESIRIRAVIVGDASGVEIVVEDDGRGVPEADLGHLFEKFYRVRRPGEGARHGMGIGLTVAQGMARAMGGRIVAGRSQLGGLAMRIHLPATSLPPEPDDAPAADAQAAADAPLPAESGR